MDKANRGGWKTYSRHHKYRGSGGFPVCWKVASAKEKRPEEHPREVMRRRP